MQVPFVIQALLALAAFVAVAGLLLALFEFSDKALDEQVLKQVNGEVADVQPVAVVASEIRVSHGSQF